MQKKTFLLCSSLLLILVGLFSCQKTENESKDKSKFLKTLSTKYSFTNFPVINNGMMVFKDEDHYAQYLSFLDTAVNGNPNDSLDDHDILLEIEQAQNFSSLRNSTHQAFLRQDAIGWSSLNSIPDEHFILSNDIKSTLNDDLDVQIGQNIIHYINKDFAVTVSVNNPELLAQYHTLGSSSTITDLAAIDRFHLGSKWYELGGEGRVLDRVPSPLGNWVLDYLHYTKVGGCSNPKLIQFENLGLLFETNHMAGYFVIDFGDGQSTTKSCAVASVVSPFTHQYNNFQTYTVKISGYQYQGGPLKAYEEFSIVVSDNSDCSSTLKDSYWIYTAISSTQSIGGRLYIENVTPLFQSTTRRVIALTKLVKQNSDGSYSGYKGNMYTSLECVKKDDNCQSVGTLMGDVYDSKKKDQTLHRTGTQKWSVAKSFHSHNDGTQHNVEITLYHCN